MIEASGLGTRLASECVSLDLFSSRWLFLPVLILHSRYGRREESLRNDVHFVGRVGREINLVSE